MNYQDFVIFKPKIKEVATDILLVEFWKPEFCKMIIDAADQLNSYESRPTDPVPGQELRIDQISPDLYKSFCMHWKRLIQPILDDPLSAIATVAAASFLGPAAAAYFGTSASVGVGIAAGAANTAAGLVQGEDFGDAVKGGLMAGVGAGVGAELFGGAGAEAGTPAPTDALDDFLAANNNFVDVPMDALASAPTSAAHAVPTRSKPRHGTAAAAADAAIVRQQLRRREKLDEVSRMSG